MNRESTKAIASDPQIEERRVTEVGMRYLWMRPQHWDGKRVVVVVHGISRNYQEHAELFLPECTAAGAALIVPRFSNVGYRGYQRLRPSKRGISPDEALLAVLADARAVLGKPITENLRLFGFSGGAQFVHRFCLVHPERVRRQAIAAAGFYTFPTDARKYPYGIGKTKTMPALDMKGFLIPTSVLVGEHDTERDEDLRVGTHLDKEQGQNRVERARRFVLAVRAFSGMRGRKPECSLSLLKDSDHSFRTCAKNGMLIRRAMQFLVPEHCDGPAESVKWQ